MRLPANPVALNPSVVERDDAVITLLQRISSQLDEIITARRSPARSVLSQADEATLRSLLPAIARRCGTANFQVAELAELARTDETLQLALDEAIGMHTKSSGRRLGRLLARAEGIEVQGLVVRRLAVAREGVLWVVDSHRRRRST